jgi:competence protein ComEC
MVWATASAGYHLHPAALAALCLTLLAGAGLLLLRVSAGSRAGSRAGKEARRRGGTARRSFLATMAVALLLSAAAGGHAAVDASRRYDGAVAAAAAVNAAVVAEVEVTGAPRGLRTPGSSGLADRWAVPAALIEMNVASNRVREATKLLVMGGASWEHAVPGQRLRTTGKLKPAAPGQAEAAVLSASSAPLTTGMPGPWQQGPAELRSHFTAAAGQFGGDARGLLPGMVTGDTSNVDAELDVALKSVGMTHLTAVSGANCSLILGALLLAGRSLRFSRGFAAVLALAGLGLFVLMVGPDASVLRAAVMGAIGVVALAGGRPGRGLSFLCLAVIVLVLAQPALSTSFGFLLSVLATLGIVVTGRPIMKWLSAAVPGWLAAGVAVPLSAQAFCGPAVVLLQPQFSSYALPANMAAAVLVAPVTLLGTAAVAMVPLAPALAAVPLGIAAAFATAVGAIARFFAGLPGAVLPWPEGAFGAATMALFSACTLAAWWLLCHPARSVGLALAAHSRTVVLLRAVTLPKTVTLPNRTPGYAAGLRVLRGAYRPGLVHRPGRGTLRVCKQSSGRKPQWLLPRPNAPGQRRRTPPPGAM